MLLNDEMLCVFETLSEAKTTPKASKIDSKIELKMLTDRLRSESRESVNFSNPSALLLDFVNAGGLKIIRKSR